MIEYNGQDMEAIKKGVEDLGEKNQFGKDESGFVGGVYCGYLRALNDVRWLFLQLDLNKIQEIQKQTLADIREINKALGIPETGDTARVV